jgi:hypothetical protein
VVDERLGFLRLAGGRGRRVLLGQLTRMHDDTAPALLRHAPVLILHLDLAPPAVAMPLAGLLRRRPPGLLDQEGQRRLLAPPRFQFLPDGTRAWDQRHEAHAAFAAQPEGSTTRGLAIRDDPAHPVQPQGQARLTRQGRFPPLTPIALPHTEAERDAAIPAHAEAQQHLFAVGPPVCALPRSRTGRSHRFGFVGIRAIERHGRRLLMEPGRRHGIDRQRCEGQGAQDLVEIGGTQRIEDVA